MFDYFVRYVASLTSSERFPVIEGTMIQFGAAHSGFNSLYRFALLVDKGRRFVRIRKIPSIVADPTFAEFADITPQTQSNELGEELRTLIEQGDLSPVIDLTDQYSEVAFYKKSGNVSGEEITA